MKFRRAQSSSVIFEIPFSVFKCFLFHLTPWERSTKKENAIARMLRHPCILDLLKARSRWPKPPGVPRVPLLPEQWGMRAQLATSPCGHALPCLDSPTSPSKMVQLPKVSPTPFAVSLQQQHSCAACRQQHAERWGLCLNRAGVGGYCPSSKAEVGDCERFQKES